MERNDLKEIRRIPSDPSSCSDLKGRRNLLVRDNVTYISYVRKDTSPDRVSFMLQVYIEGEDLWEGPVLIHRFENVLDGFIDMDARAGRIFFLMSIVSHAEEDSGVFAKEAPLDEWFNVSSTDVVRLDTDGGVHGDIDVVATDIGAVAFWMRRDYKDAFKSVYRNDVWSNEEVLRNEVGCMAPLRHYVDGNERVLFIYTNELDSHINVTFSFNGGDTFGINNLLGHTGKGITSLSVAEGGGVIHLAALDPSDNEIFHFMSEDGLTWSDSGIVATYDQPASGSEEVHVALERDNIWIAYDSGDGILSSVSFDGGLTFNDTWELQGSGGSHPSLEPGKGYFAYHDGMDMVLMRFIPSSEGRLMTVPFSPMGLHSWDAVGFNIEGGGSGADISFRVLDSEGMQLFPESGMEEVLPHDGGEAASRQVDHLIEFNGTWTTPSGPDSSVSLDVMVRTIPGDGIAISGIILDYTSSFPVRVGADGVWHLEMVDNISVTGKGLELAGISQSGSVIIGPLTRETSWPDVITVRLRAFSSKVSLRGALMDEHHSVIPSFGIDESIPVTRIQGPEQLMWRTGHLGSLPDDIPTIYLKLYLLTDEPTADPYVEYVSFEYSNPPSLISVMPPSSSVFRGGKISFGLEVEDREDGASKLKLEVSAISPNGSSADDYIDGVLWNGTSWVATFSPPLHAEVGHYHLELALTDLSFNRTGPMELPFTINVLDNPPEPPVIHMGPDRVMSTTPVNIWSMKGGSDPETPSEELNYTVTIERDGELYLRLEGLVTPFNITIPKEDLVEGQEWEIDARSFDGIRYSVPDHHEFRVANSPPEAVFLPETLIMEEDIPLMMGNTMEWFMDPDPDIIVISVSGGEGITPELKDEMLTIRPWKDWHGETGFTVTASDEEASTSITVPVVVASVDDPFILSVPDNLTVLQGETVFIPVSAIDPFDGEDVSVTSDILEVVPGLVEGENLLEMPNGAVILRTDNGMVGTHEITFNVTDGVWIREAPVLLTVLNVNDPPEIPSISHSPVEQVVVGPTSFHFNGTAFDPDLMWGDELQYEWRSSLQGVLGSEREIEVVLEPGEHEITLTVTDSEGDTNSTSVTITVTPSPEKGRDVMRTSTLLAIISVVGLLSGGLLGLLILLKRRRREKEPSEGENAKEAPDRDLNGKTPDAPDGGVKKEAETGNGPPPSEGGTKEGPPPVPGDAIGKKDEGGVKNG